MGEPFKDRAAVAAKVEWEGGVMDALDYGIHAVDMPVGDKELIAAWTALENAFNALQPHADAVESMLEAAAADADDESS
jgi:hypothetical protein